ncbi:MAG: histidine kinase [Bacteroidaceae bacterium]|nr:histidine kinase [Bacteroidaceae bacterium]
MATTSNKFLTLNRYSFANRMFCSVVGIFLLLALMFLVFQYQRETAYKVDILHNRLQVVNHQIDQCWTDSTSPKLPSPRKQDIQKIEASVKGVRITVFSTDGKVLYDNVNTVSTMENHIDRQEIRQALQDGDGYDIKRNSQTMGEKFFYSATLFPKRGIIIRSALPYNSQLYKDLTIDKTFVFFIVAITIVLCLILYQIARRLALTEHLKVEDEKLQLKRQLTQNAAHELKTPTATISAYLETLLNDPDIDEKNRRHFLERSYAQCQRMVNILSDMSALAKMDSIQTVKEHLRINLNELLQGIHDDVRQALDEAEMTLKINVSNSMALGDRSLIYSIFRNLIDNAIAYAGHGKSITVAATQINDHTLECFVSDNGVGVPPEHLPHLCERFYRIDKGRSRKLGGTGLGLAIVKNAIHLHGGEINLMQTPNGGLTVRFTLPTQ